jgi:hypothetical protein
MPLDAFVALCLALGHESATKESRAPKPLPQERALRLASVTGKYSMLLRQFAAPNDLNRHGEFHEAGPRDVKEHGGQDGLPKGFWVYVYPHWYIWRDIAAFPKVKRPWGCEQATGPPDTQQAGDIQTAWPSSSQDDRDEWLLLEYAEPVAAEAVLVHETYNPGALSRVTVFRLDGVEVEAWKGKDPTPRSAGMGVSEVTFQVPFKTNRVKIYLDSRSVPGWNEIDAVGLRDSGGKVHWAVAAEASTNYAERQVGAAAVQVAPQGVVPLPRAPLPVPIQVQPAMPAPPMPANLPAAPPEANGQKKKTIEDRVESLEKEMKGLKAMIAELKGAMKRRE